MANQSYTYTMKEGKSLLGLVTAVETYLSNTEKMETQRVNGENGDYVALQARVQGGSWKQLFGMDKAITIRFIKETYRKVRMEIGEAKWVDKGGIMLLSMFVLWPLTITSGIGMYKQGSLPGKIRDVADKYTETISSEAVEKQRYKVDAQASFDKTVDRLAAEAPKVLPKLMDSLARMLR